MLLLEDMIICHRLTAQLQMEIIDAVTVYKSNSTIATRYRQPEAEKQPYVADHVFACSTPVPQLVRRQHETLHKRLLQLWLLLLSKGCSTISYHAS
jgi:hypothetical protein